MRRAREGHRLVFFSKEHGVKILISGSSGLVGSALINSLRADGHSIARLVRSGSPSQTGPASENIRWEPPTGSMDLAGMEAADAIVHLAGASIAPFRKPKVGQVGGGTGSAAEATRSA